MSPSSLYCELQKMLHYGTDNVGRLEKNSGREARMQHAHAHSPIIIIADCFFFLSMKKNVVLSEKRRTKRGQGDFVCAAKKLAECDELCAGFVKTH